MSTDGSRRATRFCIRVKPYQRRTEARPRQLSAASSSSCRSTVMGWWMVVTSGAPRSPEQPVAERLVVVDDVELAARGRPDGGGRAGEKVSGSGKPPVHIVATSSASIQSRYSSRFGRAEGVGLAVQVEAGQLGER